MVAEGVTTNERIKKSDIKNALEQEIKSIEQKIAIPDITEKDKKNLEDQKKDMNKEYQKIENCFRSGFWSNLKQIISL